MTFPRRGFLQLAAGTVALTHPSSVDAETYRLLRINFEHVVADRGKVFAVTSAIGAPNNFGHESGT